MPQAVTLELEQFPWQAEAYESKARFKVYTKGRRAGGTSEAEDEVMEAVLRGEQVGWFFDIFRRLTKVWRNLTTRLQPLIVRVNVQEHQIEIKGGGSIAFWSCESHLTCRGFDFDLVVITESAHIAGFKEIWEEEIRPTLFDREGRAIFESSPNGFNYHQKLHERGQDPKFPSWESWQIPSTANPLLSRREIAEAAEEMDESAKRQEIDAQFVTRAGAVFGMFDRAIHIRDDIAEYDPSLPIDIGIDYGYRTFAAGLWQVTNQEEAHCIGEYRGKEEVTHKALEKVAEYANALWFNGNGNGRRFEDCIGIVGVDKGGKARSGQTKRTDIQLTRDAFPTGRVRACTRPDLVDVEAGYKRLQGMKLSATGKTRIFYNSRCKHHIHMNENLVFPKHKEGAEERVLPVKDGVNDHWFDEERYLFMNTIWRARTTNLMVRP